MSELKVYKIGLEIEATDATNNALRSISESFKQINGEINSMSLDDLNRSLSDTRKMLEDDVKSADDAQKRMDAYAKSVKSAVQALEKEAVTLSAMLTEQGKNDRERLRVLEEKRDLTRDDEKELKKLQKTVIRGTDEEIKKQILANREKRIKLKLSAAEMKETLVYRKSLKDLIKADLDGIKKRISAQMQYIKTLKTTEGRYNALKKASAVGAKAAGKIALGGIGAAAGIAGGVIGGAISSVDKAADQERAARRMTVALSRDDKIAMLNSLYVKTGADTASIVDAVNRVSRTLYAGLSKDEIETAARAEIEFPGSSVLLQGASDKGGKSQEKYDLLKNRLQQLQAASGVDLSVMQNAMNAASKSRLHSGRVSQTDYVALYSALSGSGAFSDDADIQKAVEVVIRKTDPTKPLFAQLKNMDVSWLARGQQAKNRLSRAIQNMDVWNYDNILSKKSLGAYTGVGDTDAEQLQERLRAMQARKDELLIKFIPIVEKIMAKISDLIDSGVLEKMINGILDLMEWLSTNLTKTFSAVTSGIKWVSDKFGPDDKNPSDEIATTRQMAAGGITQGKTLVGERGRELILPLEYSREGRSYNIVNNFNQNFNFGANERGANTIAASLKPSFANSYKGSRL